MAKETYGKIIALISMYDLLFVVRWIVRMVYISLRWFVEKKN